MTDRGRYRASLLLAMVGVLLMLAAAVRMAMPDAIDNSLPIFKRSRPPLIDALRQPRGTQA